MVWFFTTHLTKEQISTFSKITSNLLLFAGSGRLRARRVSLNGVVTRVLRVRARALKAAHIDVTCDLVDPSPQVNADPVLLQQAILNLYQHRERYDWSAPFGLMRRTVVNEALRLLRQPRMSLVADDHPGEGQTPVRGMMDQEMIDQVRKAIARLPEHFRAALVLCEYEQMSYVQIAQVLDASVPQVKTWLHRGRRQLAEKLKTYMDHRDEKLKDVR